MTIHRGTAGGGGVTEIGDDNVFMAYAHVAHDCHVGNHTIFGNAATLGGHVTVEDYATISAFSGVHQFCRVGKHAFIGGFSVVTKDALPYAKTVGNRARIYGLNTIGLVRREFSSDSVAKLRRAFRHLLHSNTSRALAQIERDPSLKCDEVQYLVDFIRTSTRGVGLRRPSRRLEEVGEELRFYGVLRGSGRVLRGSVLRVLPGSAGFSWFCGFCEVRFCGVLRGSVLRGSARFGSAGFCEVRFSAVLRG